jgi:hypothetical protein
MLLLRLLQLLLHRLIGLTIIFPLSLCRFSFWSIANGSCLKKVMLLLTPETHKYFQLCICEMAELENNSLWLISLHFYGNLGMRHVSSSFQEKKSKALSLCLLTCLKLQKLMKTYQKHH